MRYFASLLLLLVPLAASAADQTCLILAVSPPPTGTATWSRAGREARHALLYVAGEYPPGFPFRGQIKDKELDKIKAKGRVIVLDSQYTRADLEDAKKQCGTAANTK
jgi:hypothetical protein